MKNNKNYYVINNDYLKRKKITQKKLSEITGLNKKTISKYTYTPFTEKNKVYKILKKYIDQNLFEKSIIVRYKFIYYKFDKLEITLNYGSIKEFCEYKPYYDYVELCRNKPFKKDTSKYRNIIKNGDIKYIYIYRKE